MKLPGFTAEHSIGPTIQTYRVQDRHGAAARAALHPQADEALADEQFGDDLADEGAEDDDAAGNGEEPEGEEDLGEAEQA